MATVDEQYELVAALGVLEGIKAGAFQPSETQAAAIQGLTTVTTANGTDAATTQALANALKTKVNQIIAALKA